MKGIRFSNLGIIFLLLLVFSMPCVTQAAGDITIKGNEILRDGQPWVAKGVILVGMVAPSEVIKGKFALARQHFGTAELQAAKAYGADLIRFMISQGGTDYKSSIYSPSYVKEVGQAVALARSMGFSVIVTVQSESPSGLSEPGMASDKTLRSWQTLVPLFKSDQGVMLHIFNEPMEGRVPGHSGAILDWKFWSDTTQPVIDEIRQLGAKNVLVVDGLWASTTYKGAPLLRDPVGQLIYAVHPYPSQHSMNASDWDENFGNLAKTSPVMATAFNARSTDEKQCFNGPQYYSPVVMANLLAYLREHHIGAVGWAFDYPGTLIRDFNGTLTDYKHFKCTPGGSPAETYAVGEMLHHYFVTGEIETWHPGD